MVRCFLCGWSRSRGGNTVLYMHVWDKHLRELDSRSKFCWCGASFPFFPNPYGIDSFIAHCEIYEGLWAHYLASQLGSEVP